MNTEEALRFTFEQILKEAMAEIVRQEQQGIGRPFTAFGQIKAENGQMFVMKIEATPPPIQNASLN